MVSNRFSLRGFVMNSIFLGRETLNAERCFWSRSGGGGGGE